MKRLIILTASFLLAFNVFADNKSDQIEKEIRILKQQVEALGSNRLDPLFSSNAAEDKVNAFLTLSGYIEMSAGTYTRDNKNLGNEGKGTWMDVGVVEFIFDFDFSDQLSASIHVVSEKNYSINNSQDENYSGNLQDLEIEEAWFKWNFAQVEGLSIKVGLQDVTVGLEAAQAVDLYQWSRASLSEIGAGSLPHYSQGATLEYENEQFSLSASLLEGFDNFGGQSGSTDEYAIILKAAVKFGEAGIVQISYGKEDQDEFAGDGEIEFIDIWAVYTIGQFEIAGELMVQERNDVENEAYILRGTYNINDKWTAGIRYDILKREDTFDVEGISFTGTVKISENLSILAEYGMRTREPDNSNQQDTDYDWFVVEAFLTF